jgi:hypothetical protein
MHQNTPKHHFGSNGVEWMVSNSGTPKYCIQARNTSFASFKVPKISEMHQNTPKHHFGSNGVEWMVSNSGTPKYYIQARNTSFPSFFMPKVSECSGTLPSIILVPIE